MNLLLQWLKQERQESPAGTRQTDGKKLGLVWRNRKKISQIIKDYFYLPFFLLIILCCSLTLSHPPAGELVSEGAGRPPSPALIKQSRQGDVTEKRRKRHTRRFHRVTFERKEHGIMVMEYEPLQQLIPFQKFNDDIYSMLTSGRIRQ